MSMSMISCVMNGYTISCSASTALVYFGIIGFLILCGVWIYVFKRRTQRLTPDNVWGDYNQNRFIIVSYSLNKDNPNPIEIKYMHPTPVTSTLLPVTSEKFFKYIGTKKDHPEYWL